MNPRLRDQRGFTLMELILVIVILSVVGGIASGSFLSSIDMVRQEVALADGGAESRRLMASVVQELRYSTGTPQFTVWSGTDCSFRTVRGDSVRFTWSGTAGAPLIGRYNNVTDTLSRNVDSLAFRYYDEENNPAANNAEIDNVTVYMRLSRSGGLFPLRDYVHLRN